MSTVLNFHNTPLSFHDHDIREQRDKRPWATSLENIEQLEDNYCLLVIGKHEGTNLGLVNY